MKKLLSIVIAVIMLLSITVPVMAADIGTGVTVNPGGEDPAPFIKAKWETNDACPQIPGTQILPTPGFGNYTPIGFCVVVWDDPLSDIDVVSVDVYHPSVPLLNGEANSFKFEVILDDYMGALADNEISAAEAQAGIAYFTEAYDAGLVTLNEAVHPDTGAPITKDEIIEEIAQGEAWIYCGCWWMYYHQPAGCYEVDAFAIDSDGILDESSHLTNHFDYLPVTAAEFDFASINYGTISKDGNISGDANFATPAQPTVRNIGNTWLQLGIQQDDMGFGKSVSGWNVKYDVRIGSTLDFPTGAEGIKTWYDPTVFAGQSPLVSGYTTIPGIIHLCNTWKMDFSIHIIKATTLSGSGMMWLRATCVPFDATNNMSHPGTIVAPGVPETPPSTCPPLVAGNG